MPLALSRGCFPQTTLEDAGFNPKKKQESFGNAKISREMQKSFLPQPSFEQPVLCGVLGDGPFERLKCDGCISDFFI